jgi:hypothetical protein
MCESTVAIYYFIDDFLKASGHQEDIRTEVADAEALTDNDAAFRRQF